MPNASHLTASIIASTFPDIRIGKTRIHTMAYGMPRIDGRYALGALDLLENPQAVLPLGLINTEQVWGDDGRDTSEDPAFAHGEFDIVVDNPPFTRASADPNYSVPTHIFGDKDPNVAAQMKEALQNIESTIANGNAGLGSYFVDLADRMLKPNGVMGFVLPATVLTSPNWQKARGMWSRKYHDVIVVTIAATTTAECAFSADTNMAECLIIATKGKRENTGRGAFICLHRRPDNHLEALEIAKSVHSLQNIRQLEEPPIGGNSIQFGEELIGNALNCPLKDIWTVSRIRELSLIQIAYHLKNGQLWLPLQQGPLKIPVTFAKDIATLGFSHGTIKGPQGAFDIEMGCSDEREYPGLWYLNASAQRAMVVQPDCHCIIRPTAWDKAQRILKRSGRVHHNSSLRFNANSLTVLFTERPAIGINTIPNIVFSNPLYDYVWTLWGNSTLGLLCYWMHCNKQHSGRGQIFLKALSSMPTLDIRQLDETALQNAKRIFEEMKHRKMLPFNQMDEDAVRHELDRRL